MIVAGLTGSIAMGKTETARMFAARGIPVFDSDAAVHALYARNGDAVEAIRGIAPAAIEDGCVNRAKLAELVQADPRLLRLIESAVHPLVKAKQQDFLRQAEADGASIALLDIPLLFETNRDREVDAVIVVSADPALQRQRAMARPGMTPEKLDFILARQMPDREKRARASYVVDTSQSFEHTAGQVEGVIRALKDRVQGRRA